jgi:flagellar motor switch protein FliN/FliY
MPQTTVALSEPLPALLWRSGARRQTMAEQLRQATANWGDAWGCHEVQAKVDNAWEAPFGPSTSPAWKPVAGTQCGSTVAWWHCQGEDALGRALFGTTASAASGAPISQAIGDEALSSLATALRTACGACPPVAGLVGTGPPPSDLLPWSGAVRVVLRLRLPQADMSVNLHFSAAAWVEPPRASGDGRAIDAAPLVPVLRAAGEQQLALRAEMAGLALSLGELMGLREGDVLVTAHRLNAPLNLSMRDQAERPLFAGHLVQRDGHVAVALTSSSRTSLPDSLMSASTPHPSDSTAQWVSLPDATDPPSSAPKLPVDRNPLLDVKARLQVCVGEATMTVGELTSAQQGQVVKLDREVDGLVDLLLEGRVVARGQLVAVGDCFGICLTELPLPLTA